MADSYLTRTVTSAGNRKTWTFSCWVKRCTTSVNANGYDSIFSTNISNEGINIAFGNGAFSAAGDYFEVTHAASSGGGTTDWSVRTDQVLRDTAGWYHLVVAFDTTQSTTADRVKLYVNGSEVDKTVTTGPALNTDYEVNNTQQHTIGRWQRDGNSYFDGYLSHFNFCDGTAYAASDFGQTNSTTGIWGPKVSPSVTYGTNGFFLKFENSGSLGTDSSGNGNNWSVSGSLLQGRTTPSNSFNTINTIDCSANASQIKVSATQLYATGGGDIATRGTLGVNSGKWYWECKSIISAGHGNRKMVGFYDGSSPVGNGRALSSYQGVLVDLQTGTVYKNGSTSGTTNISSFSSGDIVGVFFDADNGEMRFSKNGNMENSGNAVATGVDMSNYLYLPYISQDGGGTNNGDMNCNFGEGYFATTAVSSGNADANGYGQFEYNPVVSSTNYYALCTKNMEQY